MGARREMTEQELKRLVQRIRALDTDAGEDVQLLVNEIVALRDREAITRQLHDIEGAV